jgi:membrane protein DedA with SNARE-associated domain
MMRAERLIPWIIGIGVGAVALVLLLVGTPELKTMAGVALGTLISEDLASIGAGLLAASGQLSLTGAIIASFTGIFIGDTLIFAIGHAFGRPLLQHRWARWFLSEQSVNRAQHLFHRHGIWIILATRFIPGTRTATYFTAGALHAPPIWFLLVFGLAAALWTPLLVGLSYFIGSQLLEYYELYEAFALPGLIFAGLILYLIFHYGIPLFTWRGRRRLKGKWLRATRWEFWPAWQVNWLVLLYALGLGIFRYGRPGLCTAVNPCMPHGGFLGESKGAILKGLEGAGEALPPWALIPEGPLEERIQELSREMELLGIGYPVVLKPDEGQRGLGVKVVRTQEAAHEWLSQSTTDAILQAFVAGNEYGVFYVRQPDEESGRIVSVTLKQQLSVTGNGEDSLETLILKHPRAIALLKTFLGRFADELDRVPEPGEVIPLGELGTHALGALFLDGRALITPELEAEVERIAKSYEGFYFGRFDIKAPDDAAFKAGLGLRVLELNGLTSEATHIYDPQHSLLHAWRTLIWQWRTAYAIADKNRRRGAHVSSLRELVRDLAAAMKRQGWFPGV